MPSKYHQVQDAAQQPNTTVDNYTSPVLTSIDPLVTGLNGDGSYQWDG